MENKKNSFLFILDSLEVGGIQRQQYEVCVELVKRGHQCTVVVFRRAKDDMFSQYEAAAIKVICLNKKHLIDIPFILKLRKIIKKGNFDFIRATTPQSAFYVSVLLPIIRKTCFVGSLLNTYKFDKTFDRLIETFITSHRMDAVIVNSKAGEQYYKSKIPHPPKIFCIHNGVIVNSKMNREQVREKLGIPKDEMTAVIVGRLQPVKRHIDAIKAIGQVIKSGEKIKFYIIGDGPIRNELQAQIKAEGLENDIIFLGQILNAEQYLSGFDIFILSSQSEGFPNVLLEAMAAGLPCISTKVGGVMEIIEHQKTGILVDPFSPAQIADAIHSLLKSEVLRNKMGDSAKKFVTEKYSMQQMTSNMISTFENLINQNGYDAAYVNSKFLRNSETFILREILEMRKRGISFKYISLKPKDEISIHKEINEIIDDIIYLPWISSEVFLYNLYFLLSEPINYLKTFFEFLSIHKSDIKELVKAFAVWWKTVTFAGYLKKFKVRHIHANWATIPTACALAMSKFLNCSFSFTGHAFDIYGRPTALKNKIHQADFVTTCTQRNYEHLVSLSDGEDKNKIYLVRHFLSFPKIENKSDKAVPPVILSVGSLEGYKGFDILLKAMSLLNKEGIKFYLKIIGGGPLERSLKELANELGLGDKVEFMGAQPQQVVFDEMSKASLFALGSLKNPKGEDNLPNVLVESALLNLPCIASDMGSIGEFIKDGETGFLCEPGNYEQLALKIKKLLEFPNISKSIANNARTKAQELFALEKNALILEKLFKKSLESYLKL